MTEEIKIESTTDARYHTIYQVTIRHEKLNKYQVIKGKDRDVVEQKARTKIAQWNAQWDKESERTNKKEDIEDKLSIAATRTQKAMQEIEFLTQIISSAFRKNENISWKDFYKLNLYFDMPEPKEPAEPEPPKLKPKPTKPEIGAKPEIRVPAEPKRTNPRYNPRINIIDKIFKARGERKKAEMEDKFQLDCKGWADRKQKIEEKHVADLLRWEEDTKENERKFQEAIKSWEQDKKKAMNRWKEDKKKAIERWEARKQDYIDKKTRVQAAIKKEKQEYLDGIKESVIVICNKVLSSLEYPDYFPRSHELDYSASNKLLIIDYQLPAPHNMPTLKEVRYVRSTSEFKEIHISQSQINSLYDGAVYQIALCTIYKLFEANHADVIDQIVFNGFVESINPSTGKTVVACILSLQANRNEFIEINLTNVDPKACFKKMKGVGSSKLYGITPIAPILNISREDKRFISSYDVAHELDEFTNIAAMDWEDFEHLIRELFEKEFSQYGGEVKITQASRDRGVDAVAFDPDPIRGGKIVIQAKRYTNTVGVSAVRDLYGTVINEGATKGILISTADYGPDAYDFAKGKPLTLLNGGNLLHLLEKHGHKAKIDLQEAKKIIAENEKQKEVMH